jgi:D-alanyl-D-alanine carboxypeptidase/D-alanyl-D-alanine-endopeptidase (penicillin-binding protein 4)
VGGVAALGLALAGCGGGGGAHQASHAALAGAGTPVPATVTQSSRPATTATVRTPPPPHVAPGAAQMAAAVARVLRSAGPNSGALVYDLVAHRALLAIRAGVGRAPASVEKLYTSVALLQMLGPDVRLHTTVLGAGRLGPGGVWHGDLYLRGGGDPTFGDGTFNRVWEGGYGPTAAQLVGQLSAHAIRRVTGRVIGDASLLDSRPGGPASGFAPDIPDFGGELGALTYDHGSTSGSLTPGAFAARQLARALRAAHVAARAARLTGPAPLHARELASVGSPPLGVLIKLMDVPSDDLFAELLTEQLGVRFGGAGTIAAGAGVIHQVIGSYDIHPRIVDGSGLSRADLSSPSQVVAVLRSVWGTTVGDELASSLPVVGVSGTVAPIARHTPAQGNCVAKTGTLNQVTNLAGYCHRPGRHVVAFALFIDGPQNWQALAMEGKMLAAIARYGAGDVAHR